MKKNGGELAIRIGTALKRARQIKNMSQDDLAALCEMEKASISRIESGKINFTISSLFKICSALDLNLSELL